MDDSQPHPQRSSDGSAAARTPAASSEDPGHPRRPSRRSLLAGGAVVVLAAAGGTAAEFQRGRTPEPPPPNPAPAELVAAAGRERTLIADLDATTGGTAALRKILVHTRADHAAHLAAFEQLLAGYDAPAAPTHAALATGQAPGSNPTARGTARPASALRAAEQRAAASDAHGAAASTGRLAVLLASVSASESSHAALIG